jgi:hypothetical protein
MEPDERRPRIRLAFRHRVGHQCYALSVSIRQHTSAYGRDGARRETSQHTSRFSPSRWPPVLRPVCARRGIRQHTSAYVSIRLAFRHRVGHQCYALCAQGVAYVSIRQHTSAVSVRLAFCHRVGHQCYALYVSIRQHTSAYVSIRQHTSVQTDACGRIAVGHQCCALCAEGVAYVSIRQHTSAYLCGKGVVRDGADDTVDCRHHLLISISACGIRQHPLAYASIRHIDKRYRC